MDLCIKSLNNQENKGILKLNINTNNKSKYTMNTIEFMEFLNGYDFFKKIE